MDSFIRIFAIYRGASRAWAASYTYKYASLKWRIALWLTKLGTAMFITLEFALTSRWPFLFVILSTCTWIFCFDRSRESAFALQHRLYPERVSYFRHDHRYLRYLEFRRRLEQGTYVGDINDALRFLSEQIESNSQSSIAAHPVIATLTGSLLVVLGAVASQWSIEHLVDTLLSIAIILYFAAITLGLIQTRQADLKEFKQFLLWAKHEQIDNQLR